jgi:hypothetical protein
MKRIKTLTEKSTIALLKKSNGCCMVCKTPLAHLSHTFTGYKGKNLFMVGGDCCSEKLDVCISIGIYLHSPVTKAEYARAFYSHPLQSLVKR